MEYLGANISKRYVHGTGVDTPLVSYTGSGVGTNRQFLHKNHQGSIIAISDNSGNVIAKNTYDAYGVPANGNVGRFGYTGQMYLAELKLYHYRARGYKPDIGGFLQTDPIGYEDQMNMYAYAYNDPMNFVDPSGMANCPPGDPNCVETPESEKNPEEPSEKSDEVKAMEEVVVTGHRERKPAMRFNINEELFFTASASGMVPRPTTQTETECPNGTTMTTTRFKGLKDGEAAVHTHTSGRGGYGGHLPYPSHGDGSAASQSSIGAAFVLTKRRVFTIEAMSNGTYRTTLVRGNRLSKSEREALTHNMRVWEGNASGSAAGGGGCN